MCTKIPNTMCLTLLTMMALEPDGASIIFLYSLMKNENMSRYISCKTCVSISTLSLLVLQLCRPLITESLIGIMNVIILQRKPEFTILLLKALPLLHILRGDCSPNEQRVVQPSNIVWFDRDIRLGIVRQTMLSSGISR